MQKLRLQEQLHEDVAQAVPPFAADSITLARKMGSAAAPVLLEQINPQGEASFLALEALREAAPEVFHSLPSRLCADIYAEALRTGDFYNTWGVPGHQLTDTANAFIGLGETAVAVLRPLLDDKRDAPLSGSHEATTSKIYGNRLCDYAWVLISEIMGRPYVYSQDPAERDQAIQALRDELNREIGHE
ncbi:MAG TPA: hypothetical protein DC047_08440 [Blastocatellia bacterium]|nr:hypothetical protein [Blastocatellia bacterium]